MIPRLSVLVVTSGRETLTRTLASIAAQSMTAHDEVLVVGASAWIQSRAKAFGYRYLEQGPFGCFGQRERQWAMSQATGTHLLFMDDDDFYVDGAFAAIRSWIARHPRRPLMFRMLAPTGHCLPFKPVVEYGNVSGTQFVVPNEPDRLGRWELCHEGDFYFIESTLAHYGKRAVVWCPEVIAGCRDQGVPAGVAHAIAVSA